MSFTSMRCPICLRDAPSIGCPVVAQWVDEERMSFLTSHVAKGEPDALADMAGFWSSAVKHAYEEAGGLSLDPSVLARTTLSWHGTTSPGLVSALQAMISSGELVRSDQVVTNFSARLTKVLVYTPLSYGLGLLWPSGPHHVASGEFVHRQVLESVSSKLSNHCQNLPEQDRTVVLSNPQKISGKTAPCSLEWLCKAAAASADLVCGNQHPGNEVNVQSAGGVSSILGNIQGPDLELLVDYLVYTNRAVRQGRVIKLMGEAGVGKGTTMTITEADKNLLFLRCTVVSLEGEVRQLQQRSDDARLAALKVKKQGQTHVALMHMRRRKLCEGALSKRTGALSTLEEVLHKVESLQFDRQVLEAQEAATKALRGLREDHNLSVDRVDDAIEALAEEMEEQDAISNALGQMGIQQVLDDSEEQLLEKELAQLLLEEENTSQQRPITAPAIPLPMAATGIPVAAIGTTAHSTKTHVEGRVAHDGQVTPSQAPPGMPLDNSAVLEEKQEVEQDSVPVSRQPQPPERVLLAA